MAVTSALASGPSTDRYEVSGLLGKGGMGAVYRARDRQNDAAVALKRLMIAEGDNRRDVLMELFHQEFRTLAQLQHPHVVHAFDFGIDEQGPYYTMELLQGEDLHGLSPMPWREACGLLRDVCSAAALLHSRRLLHRDLSPKNIQRTHDLRAKLFDFGAMAPMGLCKTVVGTPPLVPPEAIMQQPLDGRADLYALGGTLYYVLTGAHAYPARDVGQLRALWRTPVPPPSARAPEVPPELDALVMSLLSPDPVARPRSAAELIDRLTAIAALGEDEQLAVSHAYLSTPELVGRAHELARVRARLGELIAGRGGAIVIRGASGMGRSRMLDASVLESKLAGIAVARASAADSSGAYGTISALLQQLWDLLPSTQVAAFRQGGALALFEGGEISAEIDTHRRVELQGAFAALLRAFTQVQPLLLAIDDLERCDEPSQAALAAVALACRRERVLIAATLSDDPMHDHGAIALVCDSAVHVALSAFEPSDTEALLGSVFGDVPHLQGVSARIHAHAEGSPRGCMELAQHLRDHGHVHYRMGSWVLPAELDDGALPGSLSRARRMKLEGLSADARELGAALAVAQGSGLDFEAYDALTTDRDHERVRKALDELLRAQILRSDGLRYVFEAQVWAQELRAELPTDQSSALSVRVAEALAARGRDRLDVARYLWQAGEWPRVVEVLLAELAVGTRWDRCPREYGQMLQAAVDACTALGRSKRDRFVLLSEIARVGRGLALADIRVRLADLFAQLRDESGHSDWEQLDPALEPLPRLQRAMELVQARYDNMPEHERGLKPLEAIIAVAHLVADTIAIAAQIGDYEMFALLPDLSPFFPLSPVIERLQKLSVPASKAVVAGRYEHARSLYRQSLDALMVPGDIDESLRMWSIRALHYAIGSIDAGLGREPALAHAAELEPVSGWAVPAWTVRLSYYYVIGNLWQAERCRKQIELRMLESPVKPQLSAGAVHQHVFAFSMSDHLTGMRRAIPEMEALARAHPTFMPFVPFTRAEHARICGNYDEALVKIDEALQLITAGEHPLWPWMIGSRLTTLLTLERTQEAHAFAVRALETANSVGLEVMRDHIEIPLALIEAKLGNFASACERLDRMNARRHGLGMQGVTLGWVYEARARVALWMADNEGFVKYAQLCALQYRRAEGDPALAAKYERLMQEARTRGMLLRNEVVEAIASNTTIARTIVGPSMDSELATALRALSSHASRPERARQALRILLESAGAVEGELYLVDASGLVLVAASVEGLCSDEVHAALARLLEPVTANDDGGEGDTAMNTSMLTLEGPRGTDGIQLDIWPFVLTCSPAGHSAVAGIAALHFRPDQPVRLPSEIGTVIADALFKAGDLAQQPRSSV
jgi:tetratricopeptide (TPR) repeat protein